MDMTLPRVGPGWAALAVGAMLACFAVLSFTAALGKSATYDEPLHLVGGMVHRFAHDYRINPEDPALFGWWASLPHAAVDLPWDPRDPMYAQTPGNIELQWPFVVQTLFVNHPERAQHFLNLSRAMFLPLGIALGALIATWSCKIAGSWAAIISAACFSFDPNFLAHSALVKNDVPLALLMCALAFSIWRFGRDGGWHWLALGVAACGIAINVKFSGVIFAPLLVLLLAIRAMLPTPWRVRKRLLENRRQRMAVVLIGALLTFGFCVLSIWSVYGFRYAATSDGKPLDAASLLHKSVVDELNSQVSSGQFADDSQDKLEQIERDRLKNSDFARPLKVDLWMQQHHLLPEGWLFGFLFTYITSRARSAFLLSSVRTTGWWYYFPLVMLFKTPAATLLAMLLIPLGFLLPSRTDVSARAENATFRPGLDAWTVSVLTLPPALYFLLAITTNLNLGVRHILPVYPFLFILIGVGASALLMKFPVPTAAVAAVLFFGLMTESLAAYPNFIPFFNIGTAALGGGIELLGDSNLDWGQDLPALAQWQRENPHERLYFCYFGTADPNAYGIHFINMRGGWPFSKTYPLNPRRPGVVAISATHVQGIYLDAAIHAANAFALRGEHPFRVLNGTIYLYRWPPQR